MADYDGDVSRVRARCDFEHLKKLGYVQVRGGAFAAANCRARLLTYCALKTQSIFAVFKSVPGALHVALQKNNARAEAEPRDLIVAPDDVVSLTTLSDDEVCRTPTTFSARLPTHKLPLSIRTERAL